jgi:hypothetical protein
MTQKRSTAKSTAKPSTAKSSDQPATDWVRLVTTPDTAADATGKASSPASRKSQPKGEPRGSYNVIKVAKKAQTFRLPQDVFDLIEQAQAEAAAAGNRLTNDEAITQAVRGYYGGRRRRRSS